MLQRLLSCWVLLSSPACFIPQEDQVIPDLPPKRNNPLRILTPTVKPEQRRQQVKVGTPSENCLLTEFSMTVIDEDVEDAIRSQWYVDPTPNYELTASSPVFNGAPIFPGKQVNRQVTAPNSMLTFLASLQDEREHIIEAWVTDSDFLPGSPTNASRPNRQLSDGTLIPDAAYTDSRVWVVTVEVCE